MRKAKRKSIGARLLVAGCSLLLVALCLELLLRSNPLLLPMGMRSAYPLRGIEFLRPGVLSEMPLDELWVPLVSAKRGGIPPADLKDYGVAPLSMDLDAQRFPRSFTPSDANGLPNAVLPEQADIVLVGDSLLLAASTLEPSGLVSQLQRASGLSTYSMGVPGIGPQHEASLLERVGLALKPRLVLWFFFGGNDLNDAKQVSLRLAAGKRMYADRDDYRSTPASYLMSYLAWRWSAPEPAGHTQLRELAPLFLHPAQGEAIALWLHPAYLARTTLTRAKWEAHQAWGPSMHALELSRMRVEAQGARFVVVYLPSKSEALLPALAEQKELLLETLQFDLEGDLAISAEQAYEQMLANRGSLREALAAHCLAQGIPFFSASEVLERQALAGEAGYFATDTHWMPSGQALVLESLLSFLRTNGMLAR